MEGMMKQMRVKFVGPEQEGRDPKIPAQKTQSFKEKKTQNWFQRQFQRKTSQDYDSREIEHAVAIAAAAFAVASQEVSEIPEKKKDREAPGTSLTKTKSKRDGSKSPETRLSVGNDIPITTPTDEKKPEKTITPAPSTKKTQTFREHLKNTEDKKQEMTETPAPKLPPPVRPGISIPPPPPPPPPPRVPSTKRQMSRKPSTLLPLPPPPTRPAAGETKADVWEREELERIKEKYNKVHETINTWEKEKKMKSKKKLNKQEGELERRRVKATQKFKEEIQYVDKIAGRAREQAKERQRTEEHKTKEKADAIRKTGKVPATCYCF